MGLFSFVSYSIFNIIIDLFGLYNQLLKRLWLYAEYTEILIFGKDAKSLERNLFF